MTFGNKNEESALLDHESAFEDSFDDELELDLSMLSEEL